MHYQSKQDLASAYFPDHSNVAPSESNKVSVMIIFFMLRVIF